MAKILRGFQKGSDKPRRFQTFQWIGLATGAALGAVIGGVEYGEPLLGALVGTGLAGPIALLLHMRFPDSA